ncbi:ethanolamine kinase 1 isoform X2 [Chanos chanos]|uniref:ethanolamine kinase n=1 Tax=Chanos chanos TaxID=29144 RepID=A0A6J2WDU3_CHACN|nr:ethanolamine kinase 1-like isoform X2 [Chanos chanos]
METHSEVQGNKHLHLDVCVADKPPHHGVTELLRRLRPQWRPEDIQMKVFTEGITNQLMGFYVGSMADSDVVLVRVYGRMTELFVDRDKEVEMLQVLSTHGCGPQIFCTFQNGICYEFMRGVALDDTLLRQPAIYRLIATEMGKIHSIKSSSNSPAEPVLWTKVSLFLELVQNSQSDPSVQQGSVSLCEVPSLEVLFKEMEELKRHLSHIDSPTVLCHNDLLSKNIIYNPAKGSVKFIDFEYADFNYQAYDISNHFNEFAGLSNVDYSLYPSCELQRDWLTAYLESYKACTGVGSSASKEEVQELYIKVCKFSLASHFSWGLWALLQARYSTIDFDFLRYATARFNYYFEKKQEYFGLRLP